LISHKLHVVDQIISQTRRADDELGKPSFNTVVIRPFDLAN